MATNQKPTAEVLVTLQMSSYIVDDPDVCSCKATMSVYRQNRGTFTIRNKERGYGEPKTSENLQYYSFLLCKEKIA